MSGAPCQPLVTEIFEGPLVGPCGRRGLGGGGGGGNSAVVAAGVSSRGCDSKTLFYSDDDEDAKRCRASAAAASSILGRAREEIASGAEDAFLVMDMDQVRSQAARWRRELPRVLPLYAVKCQPDVEVIKTLAREGFGFDVASAREMELVLEHGVPNGLSDLARNVIYANPCKMPSHIKRISTMGAEMTTLDNVDELRKVHANWPAAKIVVRILGDDTFSVCQFNKKFGIAVEDLPALLAEAKRLGANVVGVSFHVGSGCTSAVPFAKAIEAARRAFDMIEAAGLGQPKFLDLGGGWPGTPVGVQDKHASFEDIAALVRVTLDRLFPAESGVRIVAEPGRYFVAACGSLYTAVHARRAIFTELPDLVANQSLHDGSSASASCAPDADDVGVSPSPAPVSAASSSSPKASANAALDARIRGFRIYVNEGTYGCFNAISNDHLEPAVGALIHADGSLFDGHGPLYECSVWGPTCDSVDMISASLPLPIVQIGDWIEWPQMGAYTSAACAQFNGLPSARIIHINA